MALETYRRKRDFKATPEPSGQRAAKKKKGAAKRRALAYVIQKHDASRLHYDFRLEHGGVLLSWAVPKGPSLDPAQKRLAVHVEDHPLEYGSFEGSIPAGQYGAGNVIVWDRGTWEPLVDVDEGLRTGRLKFRLNGEKLTGEFALARMAPREGERAENWLLIKHKDEVARPTSEYEVTEALPHSVVTGRDVSEVGGPRSKQWQSSRAGAKAKPKTLASAKPRAKRARPASARAAVVKSAEKTSRRRGTDELPRFVEPELATLVTGAPDGADWLHETKFDGYRALCRIDGDEVTWLTRRGNDWTDRFGALTPAAQRLRATSALIDGEIVVLDEDGSGSFNALQRSLDVRGGANLTYFAFDLLHLDGRDLRGEPLARRKQALEKLLKKSTKSIRYSAHVVGHGGELFRRACEIGGEGIVSKRADSTYVSGRTREWLKTKCTQRQELVVGGWTEPEGSRTDFGALLLGYYDAGELRYAGRVGTGFDARSLRQVLSRLRETPKPPFVDPPRGYEARGVHWARPTTVVEVEFGHWTADGKLRHASFEGLREDKRARDVVREEAVNNQREAGSRSPKGANKMAAKKKGAVAAKRAERPRASSRATTRAVKRTVNRAATRPAGGDDTVAGVRITHPDRVVAEPGITKLDVARYYEIAGDLVLQHVAGRPLSVIRCPTGVTGECFFQRHLSKGFPAEIHEIPDPATKRAYVWIDSLEGLVALVQMGVLELHPWGTRVDALDRPDRMIFDLDPDPSIGWKQVVDTAFVVKAALEELGLVSFVKTTGGKGLHVTVPLARRNTWEKVKGFSRGVATALVRAAPDRFIAETSKASRRGRIFIDWLRNARAATAVAAYSTRARPGIPIAMPLTWAELRKTSAAPMVGVNEGAKLFARKRADPWKGFFDVRQTIGAKALRSVGSS